MATKLSRDQIVTLRVMSWIGLSSEAVHYYGELRGYIDEKYHALELKYELTESRAATLNVAFSEQYPGDKFGGGNRAGMMSNKFDSEEELIKFARREYKKHFPLARRLKIDR